MDKQAVVGIALVFAAYGLNGKQAAQEPGDDPVEVESMARSAQATFGSGCFWCTEAVFERLDGVVSVVSGYAGGEMKDPSYRQVTTGRTGHAEVCRIEYDPETISYAELLDVFWKSHDPTTPNRQGADVGTQYRSIILTHDEQQHQIAEESRSKLAASGHFRSPIVTQIEPLTAFYPAEDYHQDYFRKNPNAAYCIYVIKPKLRKLDQP